jgi:S1-C subfamily serine protease
MRNMLLAVLALALFTIPSHAEWPSDRMDRQIDDTNIILGMDGSPMCSGTIISAKDRLILTAAHCVTDAYSTKTVTEVDPKTGEVHEKKIESSRFLDVWQNQYQDYLVVSAAHFAAKPIIRDAVSDVAVIQIVDRTWTPKGVAPFASHKWQIRRGQTIYVVGNPAGILDGSVSKGIVSMTQRALPVATSDETPYFQVDATVIGGNSGGSVYNDNGELIGVVSAAMTKGTIGFAVPIKAVRDLLVKAGFKDFQ